MPVPQTSTDQRFSYADYLAWLDGDRWELIDGVPCAMSPAPGTRLLSQRLEKQLDNYLTRKSCCMFHAPFDVRLYEQQDAADNYVDTVVQPDFW